MNKAILVGTVAYPPVYNDNQWGGVLSMRVKTTHRYKDNAGEIKERNQQIRVALWGKLASLNRSVGEGDLVSCEGRIQNKKVQLKDGSEEWRTEVVANSFETLIGGGGVDRSTEQQAPPEEFSDDNIPF